MVGSQHTAVRVVCVVLFVSVYRHCAVVHLQHLWCTHVGALYCVAVLLQANGWHVSSDSPCAKALDAMEATMGPINQYDILGKCFNPPAPTAQAQGPQGIAAGAEVDNWSTAVDYRLLRASRKLQLQQREQQEERGTGQSPQQEQQPQGLRLASAVGEGRLRAAKQLRHAVSCADRRYASVYYNSPEVRAALHAADMQQLGR